MKALFCAFLATSCLSAIDSFSTYERAEFYFDHSWQQSNVAFSALNRIPLAGTEKILEIGCRGGRVASNLAGRVPNGSVIGAEMRGEGAIDFARKNHSEQLYPNLSFLTEDFRSSKEQNEYDLIISFSSLHWFQDQKEILERAHAALKNGGEIFFTIPCKPLPEVEAVITTLTHSDKWKDYFTSYVHPRRKFTADEYKALLEEVGFIPLTTEEERHSFYFENKRDLINWFRSFSAILDVLPEDRREDFLIDYANTYILTNPITLTGQIPFHQNELFIQAKK